MKKVIVVCSVLAMALTMGCTGFVARSNYDDVVREVNMLRETYPPRYFNDATELLVWLGQQTNPPLSTDVYTKWHNALVLQTKAARSGFIISVYYVPSDAGAQVYAEAVVSDGTLYWWNPETDEISTDKPRLE